MRWEIVISLAPSWLIMHSKSSDCPLELSRSYEEEVRGMFYYTIYFIQLKIITIHKNNKKKVSVIYKGFPPKYWFLSLQVPFLFTKRIYYADYLWSPTLFEFPQLLNKTNVLMSFWSCLLHHNLPQHANPYRVVSNFQGTILIKL